MKTVVAMQDLAEWEIRPNFLLDEYHSLTRLSVAARFPAEERVAVASPADPTEPGVPVFDKLGFQYRECRTTGSLFVSPRPTEAALTDYYRDSEAGRFWREKVLAATDETRTEKLSQPRADWVIESVAEHKPDARSIIDVSVHGSAVTESILADGTRIESVTAASATADLDYGRAGQNVAIAPGTLSDLARLDAADVLLAFDAVDRCADLRAFEAAAHSVLRPGGLLFISAPTVGFEIQVLWEHSRTLMPPDKLNVLSVEGFLRLFSSSRWEIVELSTPGIFDVHAVRAAMEQHPDADWPRHLRYLARERGEHAHAAFQKFLQEHRLASFCRLLARRVG